MHMYSCEVNDIGGQVADILQFDLEYDNLLMCAMRGRAGQVVGQGFSGNKTQMGVKMSTTVKKTGCANMKQLIEDDKLIINDYDVIAEVRLRLFRRVRHGKQKTDVMMTLLCVWLCSHGWQHLITSVNYNDADVRHRMYMEQKEQIEADMAPVWFYL